MRKLWIGLFLTFCSCNEKTPLVFEGTSMTMPYKIIIAQEVDYEQSNKIIALVQYTFEQVNKIYNNWNEEAEISLVNKTNTSMKISKELYEFLIYTQSVYQLTEKRFDPTIGALSKDFYTSFFTGKALEIQQKPSGWNHLSLSKPYTIEKNADVILDLCGISKGYCIDLIAGRLLSIGINHFLIEWGGEIVAMGHNQNNLWKVQVDQRSKPIELKNQAIATSGNTLLRLDDGKSHIFDPQSNQPMKKQSEVSKVTVVAPSCALADALATAAMTFDNLEDAKAWAERITKQKKEVYFWFYP